jgi:hypothetical protein
MVLEFPAASMRWRRSLLKLGAAMSSPFHRCGLLLFALCTITAARSDVAAQSDLATQSDVALQSDVAAPPRPLELCDGKTLAGWHALGDAIWEIDDGCIVGRVGGGKQSFLVSDRAYSDFELTLELRNDDAGNSGVQVRSHVNAQARLIGYQIEIDPSERAWSGGLYDEGRRGWLDDLSDDPAARQAFQRGAWNQYRIVCEGPWIRAWVNGVATADRLDPLDLDGHFALQVHAGNNTRMRWRELRLIERGRHAWRSVDAPLGEQPAPRDERRLGELLDGCGAVRLRVARGADVSLRLLDPPLHADQAPQRVGPAVPVQCGGGLIHDVHGWRVDVSAAELRGAPDALAREICWIVWRERLAVYVDGVQTVDWRAQAADINARALFVGSGFASAHVLERAAEPTK